MCPTIFHMLGHKFVCLFIKFKCYGLPSGSPKSIVCRCQTNLSLYPQLTVICMQMGKKGVLVPATLLKAGFWITELLNESKGWPLLLLSTSRALNSLYTQVCYLCFWPMIHFIVTLTLSALWFNKHYHIYNYVLCKEDSVVLISRVAVGYR